MTTMTGSLVRYEVWLRYRWQQNATFVAVKGSNPRRAYRFDYPGALAHARKFAGFWRWLVEATVVRVYLDNNGEPAGPRIVVWPKR